MLPPMVDSVARYSVPIHVNQTSYKFEIFSLTIDREVTGNFFLYTWNPVNFISNET